MMTKLTNDYRKALVEIEAVLSCLEPDTYNKIPPKVIEAIEKNKDEEYIFKYEDELEYEDWDLMLETKALLYNIFKKYLATDEEKEFFSQKEKYEIYKMEKEKVQKYQYEGLLKKNKVGREQKEIKKNIDNASLISYKENVFIRIFNKIKSLFKKNKI
jgi:hypothetical protein